ncbi:signal peptide containing protein [Theileria equi strain WA]|uniref:Signal peptide containing protein n=1 Tax=Theileria equi strain WA TaxID=1537102 RepID=L1L9W9_THEEQ|nr:signal peptide containing protein [Theileria equi strain WA]EKX72227.1 signal peptide containing protein [Theileria equi strain WA]|eukprot:XP_004831679.1 signal peptide containing protein [Theileria equi strain WA]
MRLYILLSILAAIKLCSAGWPCCFKCCTGGDAEEAEDQNVLDISKVDKTLFQVEENDEERAIYPRTHCVITEVLEGNIPIWKAQGPQTCSLVRLSLKKGSLIAAKLSIVEDDKTVVETFTRKGNEWTPGDSEAEMESMHPAFGAKHQTELSDEIRPRVFSEDTLKRSTESQIAKRGEGDEATKPSPHQKKRPNLRLELITPLELDISNPDKKNICAGGRRKNGMDHKSFFPRKEYSISSVHDNGYTIWKSLGIERCFFVEYYSARECMILYIEAGTGKKVTSLFFEKSEDAWVEIDSVQFAKRLQDIKQARSSRSSTS